MPAPRINEAIELRLPRVTEQQISAFRHATRAGSPAVPPTLLTMFREPEFRWLEETKVDLRGLLHTDQEYVYLAPIEVGDEPVATAKLVRFRERHGTTFITVETSIVCAGVTKATSTANFVVRSPEAP